MASPLSIRRLHRSMDSDTGSKLYSVTALYLSMSADADVDLDDALARAQRRLRDLKAKISIQSKRNFLLEKDVRYLDSRIALLIQNKIALSEQVEVADRLEQPEIRDGTFPDKRKLDSYGNLFFILQTEPRYIAALCRLLSMSEMDSFLQTVMFTIYGNQYEQREEHLLLTMFQSVLSAQFDAATEFSSLLRANTPVSRMMTTYTRRGPGQNYLKLILSNHINQVLEQAVLDLEVNPSKVYDQIYAQALAEAGGDSAKVLLAKSVYAEAAAANEQVLQIIRPRVSKLLEIANSILNGIVNSIDLVPYGIRWICKQIRTLTRRKYPSIDNATVCTLIGAFFFLRYINPAIVTPQSYMLVDSLPADNPRRTLTLVAKMLQSLANKPIHAKEPYMAQLSAFIDNNKSRMNTFLNELCDVPDFYETLELDHYLALSKNNISLSITINEVYGMHSLIEKHQQTLCPDKRSPLAVVLNELSPAPALLPHSENFSITLPLFSRFEAQIEHPGVSLDVTPTDLLFTEAKALLVQLVRSLPVNKSIPRPLNLDEIADYAASATLDVVVVKKGIHALTLLKELDAQGVDRTPLVHEIEEELAQLGSRQGKVLEELRSLESVYKSIKDHNEYLRAQLDTYKSYLQNVRSQSGPKKSNVNDRIGLVTVQGKDRAQQRSQLIGPFRFSQQALQKEGVIVVCNVPENRVTNLYFYVSSPTPGTFVVSLHYKGRSRGLLELNLKLDDLLEMINNNVEVLDLEYVVVHIPGMLDFLQRQFSSRKR